MEKAPKENLEIVLLPRGEREGNVNFPFYLGHWYQVKATDSALMLSESSFPLNTINGKQEHGQLPPCSHGVHRSKGSPLLQGMFSFQEQGNVMLNFPTQRLSV